jgi:SAM-dependent methyltransferase
MSPRERWLVATWPFVRKHLPAAPARVVDLGCGSLGGFVPMLRASGYEAFGIDPQAPDEPHYHRSAFESAAVDWPVDAVVASTSLHHVADPATVIDAVTTALTSRGALLVIEWAWEDFDAETAAWCFDRLAPDEEGGWLHRRRGDWLDSRQDWLTYIHAWAERERLHRGGALLSLLDARFERHLLARGPYFFADLAKTTEADEQAAIDAGHIRGTRIDYVGAKRS